MARTDIHLQDAIESTNEGTHINVTAVSSTESRGMHVIELPITGLKAITPASNTSVDYVHKGVYTGDGGDIAIRFTSGGTVYTLTMPAGGKLAINLYSIDSFTGADLFLYS